MLIVKIGGGEKINLAGVIADLASQPRPFIIVHGANALRDEMASALNIPVTKITSVSGVSSVLSDEKAIDLLMLAYAGLRNKRIVELCQQNGINAVGLTGLDGRLVQGARNNGIRVRENGKTILKRDFSGKPRSINTHLLKLLIAENYVPVLTVPIIDENGCAINSENDDIVALLAEALEADTILQFIEAPGLLANASDPNSLLRQVPKAGLLEIESKVEGRMRRKIMALEKLFEHGAARVVIADGRVANPVQAALAGEGTVIQ